MPTDETDLLQDLMRFKPEGMTPNRWASLAGVSRTVWSDMRRHNNPARRTLEKLLGAAGSSLAEFEALRVGKAGEPLGASTGVGEHRTSGWRGAPLPPIPLFAARPAASAEYSSLIAVGDAPEGAIERPAALATDRNAYALIVVEDSMWPRFRVGRRLIVSPAAAVANGDDVLVRLAGKEGFALVKELVGRPDGQIELRQFNPALTFRIAEVDILAVEKVVGEAI